MCGVLNRMEVCGNRRVFCFHNLEESVFLIRESVVRVVRERGVK